MGRLGNVLQEILEKEQLREVTGAVRCNNAMEKLYIAILLAFTM